METIFLLLHFIYLQYFFSVFPVGEPLNHEAWEWYYNVIGEKRCDIVDTWWQTETGGIAITPRPSAPEAEIRPAMPMRPFFGIEPILIDPQTVSHSTT